MTSRSVPPPHMRVPVTHSNSTAPTLYRSLLRFELLAERLLGRHVRHLSLDLARPGLLPARVELGDAEVEQLHVTVVGNHHVVRAHVAVHHVQRLALLVPELVGGVQAVAHLGQHVRDRRSVEPHPAAPCRARGLVRGERPRKRLAFHVLHREEQLPVQLAEREGVHHARVPEQGRQPRLAQEHLLVAGIARLLGQEPLQSHHALEACRAALERDLDRAHAAPPHREQRTVSVLEAAHARESGGKSRTALARAWPSGRILAGGRLARGRRAAEGL